MLGMSGLLSRFYSFFFIENLVSKQCRPRSDATLCGVGSGSAQIAYDPFKCFQVRMGQNAKKVILWKQGLHQRIENNRE